MNSYSMADATRIASSMNMTGHKFDKIHEMPTILNSTGESG